MYTISKDMTVTKIKSEVKQSVTEFLLSALKEKYGEDSVAMIRTGGTSKTNEIGFIVDTVENGDETNSVCVTINPTVKEFANRRTDKRVYTAFDFNAALNEYENYLEDKAAKATEAAENKAKKKANDEAKRKKKSEEE